MSYGCELWGPELSLTCKDVLNCKGEELHRTFMRMTLWVHNKTPIVSTMEELKRVPVVFSWVKRVARFWNQMFTSKQGSVLHNAFLESINLSRDQVGWVWSVQKLFRMFSMTPPSSNTSCIQINSTYQELYSNWYNSVWHVTRAGQTDEGEAYNTCAIREWADDLHDGFK